MWRLLPVVIRTGDHWLELVIMTLYILYLRLQPALVTGGYIENLVCLESWLVYWYMHPPTLLFPIGEAAGTDRMNEIRMN